MNRDLIRTMHLGLVAAGGPVDWDPDVPMDDGNPLGEPESAISLQVDVSDFLHLKRTAMEAHRSQATDIESFLALPPDAFQLVFGTEHFIESGHQDGETAMRLGWILDESP
jgi:LmbE family N-acetylglucosaminyl deacetylase